MAPTLYDNGETSEFPAPTDFGAGLLVFALPAPDQRWVARFFVWLIVKPARCGV